MRIVNRKKGFTLIEIMIVLSIIGLLSIILVPKVGALKLQSKNNSVSTSVLLVRTYLENRCAKDSSAYKTAVNGNETKEQALTAILKNIETDMNSNFSGSNSLINPFNSSKSITKDLSGNSSVLLSYSSNALPKDNDAIVNNSTLPAGENVKGNVVIIVYGSTQDKVGGYALYGIDSDGKRVNPYIIKFKASTVINENTNTNTDSGMETNVNKVVNYIRIDAIRRIIMGVPENKIYEVIQGPLYKGLIDKFTPGNASKHIVNPYYLNKDAIDDDGYHTNGDPGINRDYSIIVNANPSDYSNIDSKYSDHPGTVVAYMSKNPMGYVVYGVDKSGKMVYKTPINLSTEVTPEMTAVLGNNVKSATDMLKNNLAANLKSAYDKYPQGTYNRTTVLQSLAKNQLQQLNLKNSYIPDWTGIKTDTYNFDKDNGNSLVIELTPGNYVTDYKGTVIVDVLSDATGYAIYGIDYTGNKYAYTEVK
ncbi:prepilin-type N-terminal cleavage/methylation domain-containing protein [Clostridium sp. AWRP]|nr:prepilin-type N-terminal cleavage/methylation domain-containing protein [Clostridium sp. AWRP]